MEQYVMLANTGLRDLNPLICGWQSCEPGHGFGPAVRPYILLHYVLCGEGVFVKDDCRHRVTRGQMFVIHPQEVTFYKADEDNPWSYCWIGFEASLPLPCLEQPVVEARHCDHIFRTLVQEANLYSQKEWLLTGRLYELLALLGGEDSKGTDAERYIGRARNYMEHSFMERVSVSDTARYLGLNRSYFCRLFSEHTGMSPRRYLLEQRMSRAAYLLLAGNHSVAEVSQSCGYSDPSGFSHAFKKYYGVSPLSVSTDGLGAAARE